MSLGSLGGAWLKNLAQDALTAPAQGPVGRPAAIAARSPPPAETSPALPEAAPAPPAVENPEALSAPEPLRVKARPAPTHKAQHTAYPALKPLTPQQQWERQRVDYEIAQAAYDANERKEGYRWAQENRIRTPRYCRSAQQRTVAFMEGCLNYLRPGQAKAAGPADDPEGPQDRG